MMPNIVPPIDREYALRYLRGNTNISNDLDREWQIMTGMIEEFFIPLASDEAFGERVSQWMASDAAYPWDTSLMKIIDNLIIGARK